MHLGQQRRSFADEWGLPTKQGLAGIAFLLAFLRTELAWFLRLPGAGVFMGGDASFRR